MDLRKKSKEKKVNRMEDGCFAYVLGWDEFNGFFFFIFSTTNCHISAISCEIMVKWFS